MHEIHRTSPISHEIWDMKYRLKTDDKTPIDKTVEDTWRRVATSLASAEKDPETWAQRFYGALSGFKFLPGGRITAGAGTGRDVTLFNCFVMGTIPDSMDGIFDGLKEAALTMQQGGGIGYDFSTLRPKGALVKGVGAEASGPLTFMDVWDSMCRTIMSAGVRRGAMMGTMLCNHPDIEAFIEAKQDKARLRMFNLSVLVTDDFMEAVKADGAWNLEFGGKVYRSLPARELWNKIMRSTYAYAEPGVIFIDRINQLNNLQYCEEIRATNPCGEIPLPPYGACLLGSVNLTALVKNPFEADADLDIEELERVVALAVRMLDNAIDVSNFPLPAQKAEAKAKRRQGLGVTGLADALIMVGARYGSARAIELVDRWMGALTRAAYRASAMLAAEKGAFPLYDAEKYLASGFVAKNLDEETRALIAKHGIRNALLTSIAPTGTISLLAGNVSSGLEPVFAFLYDRNVLQGDGSRIKEEVTDFAYRLYRQLKGEQAPLTDAFVTAETLSPLDHVRMQAAVQRWIDNSISKTINCPEDISFESFSNVYLEAYESGCKGCTTYRPNDVTGAVLEVKSETKPAKTGGAAPAGSAAHDAARRGIAPRGEVLTGSTYKLKWPESDHAIYVTINDSVEDGQRRPFEVFINSKNMEHYAWSIALTRMISAVFRRGGDVSFVAEELKAVFDPRGGSWLAGRYVPSLLAAIGDIVERHLDGIRSEAEAGRQLPQAAAPRLAVGGGSVITYAQAGAHAVADGDASAQAPEALPETLPAAMPKGKHCPKCNQPTLVMKEGCMTCTSCLYSKCG